MVQHSFGMIHKMFFQIVIKVLPKQGMLVVLEQYINQQPALKQERHTHIIFEPEH